MSHFQLDESPILQQIEGVIRRLEPRIASCILRGERCAIVDTPIKADRLGVIKEEAISTGSGKT